MIKEVAETKEKTKSWIQYHLVTQCDSYNQNAMINYIHTAKYIGLITGLFINGVLFAQGEPAFPTPEGNSNQLFYLQRTPNANTVVYELNFKNGELDTNEPVHVFWIRYSEKGQRQELNAFQRNLAYGIKSKLLSPDNYQLWLVSYDKYIFYLRKGKDNKYHIFVTINQKQAILSRIYLKINGGSFWSPDIEYVEIKGNDPVTGTEVAERIKI